MPENIILKLETSELEQALAQIAQLPQERLKLFFDLLNAGAEFVRVDLDRNPARRAGDVRICLQPGNLFREFLTASRAGDGQVNVIE
ncbi:MAG: hypothetical protein D6735_10985 [Acidobacteria bacterium]|nr:MAG: hypothetical protein D6735_10985 [Acidobacteriota bacterium]